MIGVGLGTVDGVIEGSVYCIDSLFGILLLKGAEKWFGSWRDVFRRGPF